MLLLTVLLACGVESNLKALRPDADGAVDTAAPPPTTDTGGLGGGPDGEDGGADTDLGTDGSDGSDGTDGSDGGPPDDTAPQVDTAPPEDTGEPTPEDPYPSVDPCDDAPDIDCPVDVLDPTPCTGAVAAWLPSGATHSTVQSALDDALPGDTVAICDGRWVGTLTVSTPNLTLRGYGAATTTLDAAGAGTVLTVETTGTTVADLTITGGQTAGAGGGILAGSTTLRLCALTVTGNESLYTGGGVSIAGGLLEVEGGTFSDNRAGYAGGAVDTNAALSTVVGASFTDNAADYAGGAIFSNSTGDLEIYASTFTTNRTGYEGGAISLNGSSGGGGACLVDTTFTGNFADYAGGALSSNGWGAVAFGYEDCTFEANSATYIGGAISYQQWGSDTSVTVSTVFRDNVSGVNGGAVDLTGGWGVLDASFYDTTFDGNRAALGGAIQAGGVGTEIVRLVDSSVLSNTATSSGGAIFIDSSTTVEATNVDFGTAATDNRPDDIPGGAGWSTAATFRCAAGVCL